MLLAVDIGNSNIVVAVFDNEELIQEWRISTDSRRTGDEYFTVLETLMRNSLVKKDNIKSSVLSSVVPILIGPFVKAIKLLIGNKPLIVSPEIYPKLPIHIPESAIHEIGSDLLCNAVEAWTRYKKASIVVDFGTALTFTAVDNKGNIQGIAITPGLGTAIRALFTNTAQIPDVALEAPESSLGTNTIMAVQSGIVLGYKGLVESLVNRMKEDLSVKTGCSKTDIYVVATGGLNSVLRPLTDCFDEVDKNFTLSGLRKIALYVED
jgi:type III pantothenate kinase